VALELAEESVVARLPVGLQLHLHRCCGGEGFQSRRQEAGCWKISETLSGG
jgi:hypothetical protein